MNIRREAPSWTTLDRIDWQILKELQADGRMTNVELASRVGISAPPCLRRVRALEKAGFILGYHARLNPKLLGFDLEAYAMVRLTSQSEPDLAAFETLTRSWSLVRECAMLSGDVDFLLEMRRAGSGLVSELHYPRPHRRAQCRSGAHGVRHPQLEIRARPAAGLSRPNYSVPSLSQDANPRNARV